jgi:hypothetical protein
MLNMDMTMMIMSDENEEPVNGLRSKRFTILLTEREEQDISEYRFSNRIATQAEAARSLIRKGLEKEMPAPAGN